MRRAAEMLRLQGGASVSHDLRFAARFLEWLQDRPDPRCHLVPIYQIGPGMFRNAADTCAQHNLERHRIGFDLHGCGIGIDRLHGSKLVTFALATANRAALTFTRRDYLGWEFGLPSLTLQPCFV